ncbi:MAG TPA: NAD-dependent epimerase/dehydratase family protein [Armatimonadota bacterium]|jgi:nucleoside-diphosphate-sugar epimerase|nr:NAD-dependent epimerase/dehydratase family protein [Armatimonadota bacterium]HOQ28407.1 NAD-dependent epimerase/dehydratase family protein [Armatimonadota bacterium]HPO72268.1 NAD-dependent epimerase/dehydratase family protein [Armatimonadota bacterium]
MVAYQGRRVLVTGGTGLIGSRLAERLALEGKAQVRALVHTWSKAAWVSRADVQLVQGDIRDPAAMAEALQGCDVVFHCAAARGGWPLCRATNVEGTRTVLEAAAKSGTARVVHLSCAAVHGPLFAEGADETAPLMRSGIPYIDTKIESEELVRHFSASHGLPATIVRPAPVWGPCSPGFTVMPVRQMQLGRWSLVDGGHGICNAVYIDHLVDALLLAGEREEALGETFLVADDYGITWGEFFEHYRRMVNTGPLPSVRSESPVARALRRPIRAIDWLLGPGPRMPEYEPAPILVRGARSGLMRLRARLTRHAPFSDWDLDLYSKQGKLNIAKARTLLDYKPRLSLDEAMRATEAWLHDQHLL